MNQLRKLLKPSNPVQIAFSRYCIIILLASSAICFLTASMVMPDSYSWLSNAISESAAQGTYFAWIARLGFLSFGLAIIWLSQVLRPLWARGAYWMHLAFAVFMISTAAFSHKPWLTNLPFDPIEDFLHSVSATGMGFAFTFGVLIRFLQRESNEPTKKVYDLLAIVVASTLSPLGELWPSIAGLLQRVIFMVAYLWYANEAITAHKFLNDPPNNNRMQSAATKPRH